MVDKLKDWRTAISTAENPSLDLIFLLSNSGLISSFFWCSLNRIVICPRCLRPNS